MKYLGNRKLYEDIIFIIARNVKSLVEHLDCQSLNESAGHNDLLSDFMYETGCNVRGYLKTLNERQKWDEESIRKYVEDNDIKSRNELATKAIGAYNAARKLSILNDLFGEKKPNWTEEYIRQFVKDNNIKTRKELETKAISAYNAALKFGILNDLFGERVAHNKKWSEDSIRFFIKNNNIKSRKELQTKAISAYNAALKFGLLNDLFGEKT